MAKRLTVKACLSELQRVKAENERLQRLVKSQRPELESLRAVEVSLRDFLFQMNRLPAIYTAVKRLLPGNDDLPSLSEMCGLFSDDRESIENALALIAGEQGKE